jgi:hypothetical protein
MTSTIPTILRSTTLVLPVAFAIGFWIDGPFLALSAVLAAVVTLVNLKILGWISTNFMAKLGSGQDTGLWGLALSTKWMVTVPAFGFLMVYTSPVAVGIGLSTVLLALPLAAAVHDRGLPTPTLET